MNGLTSYTMLGLLVLGCIVMPAYGQEQAANTEALPRLLPEDLEIELALSALPRHLREEATVYLLKRGEGFVLAREGTNAYTCFVQRTIWFLDVQSPGTLAPMCYDTVGTETYVPLIFTDAKYREEGWSSSEVKEKIQQGFDEGEYTAPRSTGISYMLSGVLRIPDGRGGNFDYYPHYMFYAPRLNNAELGMTRSFTARDPYLRREGLHGMFIVPLGEQETQRIKEESQALIARVDAWLKQDS